MSEVNGTKPRHPSLAERVATIERLSIENHKMLQTLGVGMAALLAASGYPQLAEEFFGLKVTLPPKQSSGGVILPGGAS